MNLYRETQWGASSSIEQDGRWLICESAIVADIEDPDRQHRIKVILPAIDEDLVFDEWVRAASGWCLGDGLGSVFIPEIGQEVLVSGVLGQKYNLIYHAPLYHEEMSTPAELDKETPGLKVAKNLKFICGLLMKLQAQTIHATAEQLARVSGESVELIASEMGKFIGESLELTAANELRLEATTVTVDASGNIHINGSGNVAVSASGNLSLQGRTVNKVGPSI